MTIFSAKLWLFDAGRANR